MSNRHDDHHLTELEDKAHAEALRHFAEQLKAFPINREAVERLERNLSIMALAANMAAIKPNDKTIQTDDGVQWHTSIELMDNISLCYRLIFDGAEYAVVEHFPERGLNEVWNQGRNAVEVLRIFAQEQRQALQIWTDDLNEQLKEFLTEKYPGHDMRRVADGFMHRFIHAVSPRLAQSNSFKSVRGVQI
jgi:hypothetical protein